MSRRAAAAARLARATKDGVPELGSQMKQTCKVRAESSAARPSRPHSAPDGSVLPWPGGYMYESPWRFHTSSPREDPGPQVPEKPLEPGRGESRRKSWDPDKMHFIVKTPFIFPQHPHWAESKSKMCSSEACKKLLNPPKNHGIKNPPW